MAKPIYPIHSAPSEAFAQRVTEACGTQWVVSGLEIVQYGRGLYEAHFRLNAANGGLAQKVELGPKANRKDLLMRLVEFLEA